MIKSILFHSPRMTVLIHSKKKTDENFFCTTHSELMRKKMVTKYSHIIPRTKIIRSRESKWGRWMPRVRCRDMYDILKVHVLCIHTVNCYKPKLSFKLKYYYKVWSNWLFEEKQTFYAEKHSWYWDIDSVDIHLKIVDYC